MERTLKRKFPLTRRKESRLHTISLGDKLLNKFDSFYKNRYDKTDYTFAVANDPFRKISVRNSKEHIEYVSGFVRWAIEHVEDVEYFTKYTRRVKEAFVIWNLLKNKLPEKKRDIFNYKSSRKFSLEMHRFARNPQYMTESLKKDAMNNSEVEVVFENENIKIIHPKTKESAIYYGKGTRWCTAYDSDESNYYFSYNNEGTKIYIFILKNLKRDDIAYRRHSKSQISVGFEPMYCDRTNGQQYLDCNFLPLPVHPDHNLFRLNLTAFEIIMRHFTANFKIRKEQPSVSMRYYQKFMRCIINDTFSRENVYAAESFSDDWGNRAITPANAQKVFFFLDALADRKELNLEMDLLEEAVPRLVEHYELCGSKKFEEVIPIHNLFSHAITNLSLAENLLKNKNKVQRVVKKIKPKRCVNVYLNGRVDNDKKSLARIKTLFDAYRLFYQDAPEHLLKVSTPFYKPHNETKIKPVPLNKYIDDKFSNISISFGVELECDVRSVTADYIHIDLISVTRRRMSSLLNKPMPTRKTLFSKSKNYSVVVLDNVLDASAVELQNSISGLSCDYLVLNEPHFQLGYLDLNKKTVIKIDSTQVKKGIIINTLYSTNKEMLSKWERYVNKVMPRELRGVPIFLAMTREVDNIIKFSPLQTYDSVKRTISVIEKDKPVDGRYLTNDIAVYQSNKDIK